MQAAWFDTFGSAREVLRVGERPIPELATGEVLVAMRTSAVNPSDVRKRAGAMPALLDQGYVIPHSDGAGIIEAIGEGVDPQRLGERVWVYQAQHQRRFGTAAEYLSIDARRAVPLPEHTSFAAGACLGIPAMTAHRCVFADGPVAGQAVLVTGGAGRVGNCAVRWASRSGARVIATASADADADLCREAGAGHVVNHREPDWSMQVLECNSGAPVDRVIEVDFGANLNAVRGCIRTGGVIAAYASMTEPEPRLPFYPMMYLDLTVRLVIVYDMPEAAKVQASEDIGRALREGWLNQTVAHRLPLADIGVAHELIEHGGFRGCVLLDTC